MIPSGSIAADISHSSLPRKVALSLVTAMDSKLEDWNFPLGSTHPSGWPGGQLLSSACTAALQTDNINKEAKIFKDDIVNNFEDDTIEGMKTGSP
jgi:hypothetical protein